MSDQSDIDMKSDSESSDSEESVDQEELMNEVKGARDRIANSEIDYDAHVALIGALRKLGELESLRTARENFNKIYPLSPELWIEWLGDEQSICVTDEEKNHVISLYEKAVKDYLSVKIWVEYILFMLGKGDMEATEEVYERALTACGVHFVDGILIWQTAILVAKEFFKNVPVENGDELKKQKSKIEALYRRQARIPLLNLSKEDFLNDAKEWIDIESNPNIINDLEKSIQNVQQRMPHESILLDAIENTDKYDAFRIYLKYSKKNENPVITQNIFERAVTDLCLHADIWEDYVRFVMDRQFPEDIVLSVCQRSQRNCPWSSTLCDLHMRAILLFHKDKDRSELSKLYKDCLQKSLSSGVQDINEISKIWMSYIYHLKLQVDFESPHEDSLQQFRDGCQQAMSYINKLGCEDEHCDVARYQAKIEAVYEKNIVRVRELYNDYVMKENKNYQKSYLWLEFINLERCYGDIKHARKLFRRAMERVWDDLEIIGKEFARFEREVGTVDTFIEFENKYKERLEIVQKRRLEDAQKEQKLVGSNKKKKHQNDFRPIKKEYQQTRYKDESNTSSNKSFNTSFNKSFNTSFSQEQNTSSIYKQNKNKHEDSSPFKSKSQKRPLEDQEQNSPSKKLKVEGNRPAHGETYKHDPSNDYRTVFLSNLDYSTTEEEILPIFDSCGQIDRLRLAKDFKGRSKGFGYLLFKEGAAAQKALKLDRTPIGKRLLYVSECSVDRKGHDFRFSVRKEENKLFVKGLHRDMDENQIKELFKSHADIKSLRLVQHRNGFSKGLCYIEYSDKETAEKVRAAMDGTIVQGKNISVMISDPSAKRKEESLNVQKRENPSTSGQMKTKLGFLPRNIALSSTSTKKSTDTSHEIASKDNLNGAAAENVPKSNEDFRKMFLK